jgi:CheY-like chemotaxis protein
MNAKKIMIVDDDARNIFALKATLKSRSFECLTFSDAADALNYLGGQEPVDAILLDMMMPEMDGYEMIPEIRKLKKREHTPVIAVTAQAMLGDREKCLEAGADAYLSKPVDVDKLLGLLSEL